MSDLKFTYPDKAPRESRRADGMGLMLILGFQGVIWFFIGWHAKGFFS